MRERKRVVLDAAGYRERRREMLTARADRAAEQALDGKRHGRDGPDERPGAPRRPRAPQGARRRRDLQRRRRAAPLRRRRAARLRVSEPEPSGGRSDAAGPERALRERPRAARGRAASVSSVTEPERAWRVHVEDSLTGLEVEELREAGRIADIGSGAGFPGLVLAVALPEAQVDLIESVGRKCDFMQRAIDAAGIANASVINARSEELAAGERPRGLRRGHRASRRPPLDPRRARLAAAARRRRPGRLEGQARPRRGGSSWSEPPSSSRCTPSGSSTSAPSRQRAPPPPRPAQARLPPPTSPPPWMAKKRPRG